MNKNLLCQLVILFLITQVIGMYTAYALTDAGVSAQLATDNPEDIENSLYLFVYILVFTGVLLAVIYFVKGRLQYLVFKAFESLAIFGTSLIVLSALADIPLFFFAGIENAVSWLVLLLSVGLVALRNIFPQQLWMRNMTSVIAVAGAGSLIGVSLGVVPIVIFIVLLAVYDLIAVFRTKHMVTLAKAITEKNLSFTYAMPVKEHKFEMGTGDMVVPLAVAASVLKFVSFAKPFPFNLLAPSLVLLAALAGLLLTIDYSSKHIGKALPALPPQTVLMLLALGIIWLSGI